MNEIRRVVPETEEISAIRAIVSQHALPKFISGFDVTLGEFDGEPAFWLMLHTSGPRPDGQDKRLDQAKAMFDLRETLHQELRDKFPQRYPYFRFTEVEAERHPSP